MFLLNPSVLCAMHSVVFSAIFFILYVPFQIVIFHFLSLPQVFLIRPLPLSFLISFGFIFLISFLSVGILFIFLFFFSLCYHVLALFTSSVTFYLFIIWLSFSFISILLLIILLLSLPFGFITIAFLFLIYLIRHFDFFSILFISLFLVDFSFSSCPLCCHFRCFAILISSFLNPFLHLPFPFMSIFFVFSDLFLSLL